MGRQLRAASDPHVDKDGEVAVLADAIREKTVLGTMRVQGSQNGDGGHGFRGLASNVGDGRSCRLIDGRIREAAVGANERGVFVAVSHFGSDLDDGV